MWINKTCKMQNGIIGITRNDQTRDTFCVIWAERSRISQDTRYLFNLEDEEEETTFTRSDSLPSQMKRDADDVKKLITQLTRLDVFRVNTALREEEEDGDMDSISSDIPLVSLASKDSAPTDVGSDLLRAEERGKLHVITNVKQRLIEKTELINVLADGIPIPLAIPEANIKTCVKIDGHGLIQALGKPHGC